MAVFHLLKLLTCILSVLTCFQVSAQEFYYPVSNYSNDSRFLSAQITPEHVITVHQHEDSLLQVSKIAHEDFVLINQTSIDFNLLFETSIVNFAKILVEESHIELYAVFVSEDSEYSSIVQIQLDFDLSLLSTETMELPIAGDEGYFYWRVNKLENGNILHSGIWASESIYDVYLFEHTESFDFVHDAIVDQSWGNSPPLAAGFVLEEFAGVIHVAMQNESAILNENLEVVDTYNFNQFDDFGQTWWRSFIASSSTHLDEHLIIQSFGYTDLYEDKLWDNILWKIDAQGNVVDSLFFVHDGYEETTTEFTLDNNNDHLFMGSMIDDGEGVQMTQFGHGLFFSTVDENFEEIWRDHFYNPQKGYRLHKVLSNDFAAIGIAEEFSSDDSADLLFVKYAPADIGLSTNNLSVNKKKLELFPNPASESVKIKSDGFSFNRIEIRNLSGKLVETKDCLPSKSVAISLQNFAEGIYFVTVSNDDHREVQKLIVGR
jgi:hypothetical protein